MVQPVELAWEAVVDPNADLSLQIEQVSNPQEQSGSCHLTCAPVQGHLRSQFGFTSVLALQAFGPSGLGILTVSGVPNFAALRRGLLPQAACFAVRDRQPAALLSAAQPAPLCGASVPLTTAPPRRRCRPRFRSATRTRRATSCLAGVEASKLWKAARQTCTKAASTTTP